MDRVLSTAINIARRDAETKRENAAHGGSYGDDGASALVDMLNMYVHGYNHEVPDLLKPYIAKAKVQILKEDNADEFKLFQELKKRYEPNE